MPKPPVILIVDDDVLARSILTGLLEEKHSGIPYEVEVATNGPDAIEQAIALTPDLIMLDVLLPEMDGFEICRRMRAHPTLVEIPIILLTSLNDRQSQLRGIEAGADDFISKPFDSSLLQARVRTVTRLNRFRRQHERRKQFGWVVEHSPFGYLLLDDRDAITFANPAAKQFLGLSESQIEDRQVSFRQAVEGFRREPGELWETWPPPPGEGTDQPRYLVRPESNEARSLWLQVTVPDGDQSGPEYLVCLMDITEGIHQRRHQWTFQNMVSHKLISPAMLMEGGVELLAQSADFMSKEEIVEVARGVSSGVKRLHQQVRDIIHYMEAPSLSIKGVPSSLGELTTVVEELAREIDMGEIPVLIPDELKEAQVSLSREALVQIMLELLRNAHKFHPRQKPSVVVELKEGRRGRVMMTVMDDGRHLPPEHIEKVWAPYFQAEKDFTGNVPGMGLGLSMVASLVWEVGGRCRVQNRTETPGVVVEISLPLLA